MQWNCTLNSRASWNFLCKSNLVVECTTGPCNIFNLSTEFFDVFCVCDHDMAHQTTMDWPGHIFITRSIASIFSNSCLVLCWLPAKIQLFRQEIRTIQAYKQIASLPRKQTLKCMSTSYSDWDRFLSPSLATPIPAINAGSTCSFSTKDVLPKQSTHVTPWFPGTFSVWKVKAEIIPA